jgi:sugar (pentulose or hexulose) kinase
MKTRNFIAFDLGASNGRGIIGNYDGKKIALDILTRFDNGYVQVLDHYYWNILGIFDQVKLSLRKAASQCKDSLVGIGVDSWGLDFALFDKKGDMISNPYCYRDPRTNDMIEEACQRVPRQEIFTITGVQFMQINSLYQLLAMVISGAPALKQAQKFLMIPDMINYWLTGRGVCEYTNASNTQMLDATTKQWAYPLIKAMGIPEKIFPEILEAGTILEQVSHPVLVETGLSPLPVIATVTADTGAAVASVPAKIKNFAYLSSGTWGLIGVEIPAPVLNNKVKKYNFGNEGGVFNTIRLLRNIPNLWLLQESRRIWALEGQNYSWDELIQMLDQTKPFLAYIDSDQSQFVLPENMPKTIQETCRKTGQSVPQTKGEIIRVILESLAFKYRHTIDKLTDILGKVPEAFHIVGGGARNKMLCQFAANACNMPVIVGPEEATALGNIMLQMIALGDLKSHAEGRELIQTSFPTDEYLPRNSEIWEEEYQKFLRVTGLPNILN